MADPNGSTSDATHREPPQSATMDWATAFVSPEFMRGLQSGIATLGQGSIPMLATRMNPQVLALVR